MNIDPNWISAIVAALTFMGVLVRIAIAIGKNTEITKQILVNQKNHQEEITELTVAKNNHETRLVRVETKLEIKLKEAQ